MDSLPPLRTRRESIPTFTLTPALQIEPRDYQQAALDAWRDHDRQGTVTLPTGSGKTFLGIQAIADAGVSALVITPTIDLMNQWHATPPTPSATNSHSQLVSLAGSHDVTALTVTTYDSAYRYIDEYGDQFCQLLQTRFTICQPRPTSRSPR